DSLGVAIDLRTLRASALGERLGHGSGGDVSVLGMVEAAENPLSLLDERPQAANLLRVQDVRLDPLGSGGARVPTILVEPLGIGCDPKRAAVMPAHRLSRLGLEALIDRNTLEHNAREAEPMGVERYETRGVPGRA